MDLIKIIFRDFPWGGHFYNLISPHLTGLKLLFGQFKDKIS